MKKKIREELKTRNVDELKREISNSEDLIFKLRLAKAQNKLKNLRQVFNERKKVAFMKTLIKEKTKE